MVAVCWLIVVVCVVCSSLFGVCVLVVGCYVCCWCVVFLLRWLFTVAVPLLCCLLGVV